jgi:hypothetical protein
VVKMRPHGARGTVARPGGTMVDQWAWPASRGAAKRLFVKAGPDDSRPAKPRFFEDGVGHWGPGVVSLMEPGAPKKAALSSPEPEDQEPDRPSLLTVGLQVAKYVGVAGVDKPYIMQVGVSADHLPGNQ